MKKVAIIQSNYIPWKGYFDIIHDVDCFIFLDDVQYTNRDWRNRNKIKSNAGEIWLTIPLGSNRDKLINEVKFTDLSWRKNHLKSIEQFYKKANYFSKYYELIREYYYQKEWIYLSDFNQNFIKRFSNEILELRTTFHNSSEFNIEKNKLNKIIGLLEAVNADYYISGALAKNYIDKNEFIKRNILLHYKDYTGYPEYAQLFTPFSHYVSILDLLFNTGDDIKYYIWGWRKNYNITV
jgi:hypothetical protein